MAKIHARSTRSKYGVIGAPRQLTRNLISIFKLIKEGNSRKKEEHEKLLKKLREELPNGFKIGAVVGEEDCCFDSVAQGLNELKSNGPITSNTIFNVKSLREDCTSDAHKYKNKIMEDAKLGGYFVPQENIAFPNLGHIKDGKGNKVPDKEKTFDKYLADIKNMARENGPITIWGHPEIEGKIITSDCIKQNYLTWQFSSSR